MADPIDPQLYANALPPRTLAQSYPGGPALQNSAAVGHGHQPYYLPTTVHPQQPPPAQAAPPSNLDPALDQTSPVGHDDGSPDDEADNDNEGDLDMYGMRLPVDANGELMFPSTHETPGSGKSPGDFKRPRACDSCRGLKVCFCTVRV